MEVYRRPDAASWFYRFQYRGRRYKKGGFPTLALAQDAAKAHRAKLTWADLTCARDRSYVTKKSGAESCIIRITERPRSITLQPGVYRLICLPNPRGRLYRV